MADEKIQPITQEEIEKAAEQLKDAGVKLRFRVPTRMPAVFAHQMMIQQHSTEVLLSFFEIIPPPVVVDLSDGTNEAIQRLAQEGITAECVARVLISAESFPTFVNAMQNHLKKHYVSIEEGEENAEQK